MSSSVHSWTADSHASLKSRIPPESERAEHALAAPLACKNQHPKQGSERPRKVDEGFDNAGEFTIIVHPIACKCYGGCSNAVCRTRGNQILLHAPVKELGKIGQVSVRCRGSSPFFGSR